MDSEGAIYFNNPISMIPAISKNYQKGLCDAVDYCIARMADRVIDEDGCELKDAIEKAIKHYAITLGNPTQSYLTGSELIDKHDNRGLPLTGINKKVLFDYYNNTKTDRAVEQLVCFLAIKSILGNKPAVKTNKKLIAARMAGLLSFKDYPTNPEGLMKKRTERYYMDELLNDMQVYWNVKIYSHKLKGFYMSLKLDRKQMAEMSEAKKRLAKIQQIKKENLEAYNHAKAKFAIASA